MTVLGPTLTMRRGAIASDKLRAPGPVLDAQTIADLDALLRGLQLEG